MVSQSRTFSQAIDKDLPYVVEIKGSEGQTARAVQRAIERKVPVIVALQEVEDKALDQEVSLKCSEWYQTTEFPACIGRSERPCPSNRCPDWLVRVVVYSRFRTPKSSLARPTFHQSSPDG